MIEELGKFDEVVTAEDFHNILKLDRVILYMLVNWSGPERGSRRIIYQTISSIENLILPVFEIDCSDQSKQYVVDWLLSQQKANKEFYYGGYGETLLVDKGEIIDFIKYPAQFGADKAKLKIVEWNNS